MSVGFSSHSWEDLEFLHSKSQSLSFGGGDSTLHPSRKMGSDHLKFLTLVTDSEMGRGPGHVVQRNAPPGL